jgi:hypothetical protein
MKANFHSGYRHLRTTYVQKISTYKVPFENGHFSIFRSLKKVRI